MFGKPSCDCAQRTETSISTQRAFEETKDFFERQKSAGIFREIAPEQPYYTWRDGAREIKWFATKWYRCEQCGCLWEVQYPDFPAEGFVRKFPAGIYHEQGF